MDRVSGVPSCCTAYWRQTLRWTVGSAMAGGSLPATPSRCSMSAPCLLAPHTYSVLPRHTTDLGAHHQMVCSMLRAGSFVYDLTIFMIMFFALQGRATHLRVFVMQMPCGDTSRAVWWKAGGSQDSPRWGWCWQCNVHCKQGVCTHLCECTQGSIPSWELCSQDILPSNAQKFTAKLP